MASKKANPTTTQRLLPWTTPEGKPCTLVTDDPNGAWARRADRVERVQLDMAESLLPHVPSDLSDPSISDEELRFLCRCMAEALRNVLRIAESRGRRLPEVDDDDGPNPD